MAKIFKAPFIQTNKNESAVVVAIPDDILDDTPTNASLLVTAGAEGALVQLLSAIPRATVAATTLYLWISSDGGTTKRLFRTELMEAHTVAVNTKIPETDFGYTEEDPLRLEANEELYVGIGVALASGIVFEGGWGDF